MRKRLSRTTVAPTRLDPKGSSGLSWIFSNRAPSENRGSSKSYTTEALDGSGKTSRKNLHSKPWTNREPENRELHPIPYGVHLRTPRTVCISRRTRYTQKPRQRSPSFKTWSPTLTFVSWPLRSSTIFCDLILFSSSHAPMLLC